jgi:hypothetical protein
MNQILLASKEGSFMLKYYEQSYNKRPVHLLFKWLYIKYHIKHI